MRVSLAYGEDGLGVELPDDAVVVTPTDLPGLDDEQATVARAVAENLKDARRPARVVVVFPDITRPMPNRTVLPPLLAELEAIGAGPEEVLLLCATGTHRPATVEELNELIGADLVARYRVEQHVATADTHVDVGSVDGVPVLIDRRYLEADLRIVTGFVEPHFFAGFSGGPKGVCPGLAAQSTILEAHSPARIADQRATWAALDDNPVHRFVREAAALAPPHLSVDVAINRQRQVTAVFAGPLPQAHLEACRFVERTAMQSVPGRFDVVVSTNGGHPLDRNLYQAVKGMAAAERVVRAGGTIVMAAACRDGLPAEGEFARLLTDAPSAAALAGAEGAPAQDRWQTQVLGRVLAQARVELFSDGLTDDEIRSAHLEPIDDVASAVARAARGGGRVCALPLGPLTIANPSGRYRRPSMGSSCWSQRAMASTSSPLAVQAALWALGEGGTAVDAVIACDAVLGVVEPLWTGIGGDAFCLIDDGASVTAFNGSGASPAGLTLKAAVAARAADPIPPELADFVGGLPDTSPLAVTVPGAVDAWAQLAERYGRLGLARCLTPARALAEAGFPVGRKAARQWRGAGERLRPGASLPAVVRAGQRVTNLELATSLAAIADGGAEAHYHGRWASAAADAVQRAGGVLSTADLAAHRGEWVQPISGDYRGFEVFQHPPNGQGAAVLAALARRELEPPGRPEDPDTVVAVMTAVVDGMRQAHRHVADPRCAAVPEFWTGRDTVYTAVVADGLAVSLISSVFYLFGSGIFAGGAPLQNRGVGFSLDPDHPNAVGPDKRPFHTIIPALVRRDNAPWAVFGVVGGPMQPQGQVQVLSHLIDHGRDPQAALDAPRARWFGGDLIALEAGFQPGIADALRAGGFTVHGQPLDSGEAGSGQVIRLHDDGWLEGGADHRRDGVAFGLGADLADLAD